MQLKGTLGVRISDYDLDKVKVSKSDHKMMVKYEPQAVDFEISEHEYSSKIKCNTFTWKVESRGENQELEDCFNLEGSFWYGGAESGSQQMWPMNNQSYDKYTPYVTGLYGDGASAVLEPYWLSSAGLAIVVSKSSPLFVKKNVTTICLLAKSQWPYPTSKDSVLQYDLCTIDKNESDSSYLKELHLFIINNYFNKPNGIPDELMFKRPIWSTWAIFKQIINETIITNFANDIISYNYSNCQLEIDDKWQSKYGDFAFETRNFPNIAKTISDLNKKGFRTTLWVHPFVNFESRNFNVKEYEQYWVKGPDGKTSITSWWDGVGVIVDMTNEKAAQWFISELEGIRKNTGINSFKFDAGIDHFVFFKI